MNKLQCTMNNDRNCHPKLAEGSPPSPRHPGLEPGSSITFFAKPWIPHQVRDDTRSCHPELVEGSHSSLLILHSSFFILHCPLLIVPQRYRLSSTPFPFPSPTVTHRRAMTPFRTIFPPARLHKSLKMSNFEEKRKSPRSPGLIGGA